MHSMYLMYSWIFLTLCLTFSSSYPCSFLMQQFQLIMGALQGWEQSHRAAHFAGIFVRVFHEAVFYPTRIRAL